MHRPSTKTPSIKSRRQIRDPDSEIQRLMTCLLCLWETSSWSTWNDTCRKYFWPSRESIGTIHRHWHVRHFGYKLISSLSSVPDRDIIITTVLTPRPSDHHHGFLVRSTSVFLS